MGTITKACAVCGRPALTGTTRCRSHPKRWAKGRTRAWRSQRERILLRDGYRCTHVDEHGHRCTATTRLEVGHLFGGSAINIPDSELATQCFDHNPRGG